MTQQRRDGPSEGIVLVGIVWGVVVSLLAGPLLLYDFEGGIPPPVTPGRIVVWDVDGYGSLVPWEFERDDMSISPSLVSVIPDEEVPGLRLRASTRLGCRVGVVGVVAFGPLLLTVRRRRRTGALTS